MHQSVLYIVDYWSSLLVRVCVCDAHTVCVCVRVRECDTHTVCVTLCVHLWENLLSENPAPTLLTWQPLTTPSVTRLQGASYLVRFPDPLADASVFFKVRRGPCQFHILISKDPKSSEQVH